MTKYIIYIEEKLLGKIELEAKDEGEALEIAQDRYNRGEIVCEYQMGTEAEFQVCDENETILTEWTN